MKINYSIVMILAFWGMVFNVYETRAQKQLSNNAVRISIQKRVHSDLDRGAYMAVNEIKEWNAKETAIIICDMWNEHWCKGATERVAEIAPVINNVISVAREKGVLIVHAPSDCMQYYKNHPARKLGRNIRAKKQ